MQAEIRVDDPIMFTSPPLPTAGKNVHDDIAVFEVMADVLDRGFWEGYRRRLEREFEQDEILIRVMEVEKL